MSKSQGAVYYLYSDRNHNENLDYLQAEIADVKAEMIRVEQDLDAVKRAGEALDRVLLLLNRMREIAVEATGNSADRVALSAELEQLKEQVNQASAMGLAYWSEVDAARLHQMMAALGSLKL